MSFMIVRRYILSELFETFLIALFGLNLTLMMEKLIKLSRLLSSLGATLMDFLKVVVLIQPQLMLLSLPMSFILSVLITYGRLGIDNEIMVMRVSGLRKRRLYEPVFFFSAIVLLFSFLVSLYLMPRALRNLREDVNRLVNRRAPLAIEPGLFFDLFKGLTLLVRERDGQSFKEVLIYDEREGNHPKVITAKVASLVPAEEGIIFRLKDGQVHIASKAESTEIDFEEYSFRIALSGQLLSKRKNEMTPLELIEAIKAGRKKTEEYYIELYRRITFPLLVLVTAFLAPSLSLISGRSGRVGGFFIAITLFLFYYTMLVYFENLVRNGSITHLACLLPFLVFLIGAIFLYRRVDE
ncbi:MAG: YjgP/YjgQ family permease [Nitrospirae bacterium]|nr:MAG: YjgP/YjgQ family permease [Nitrospirota bacterium]